MVADQFRFGVLVRRSTRAAVSVLALLLAAGCVSAEPESPESDDEEAEEAEPNITDADLSGLAVVLTDMVPVDPEENPGVTLNFHDPEDGSIRTSLPLTAMAEDTEMDSQRIEQMSMLLDGRFPRGLTFSADFRRVAWENSETGAVHVAELDDDTAEYRHLSSFEIEEGETLSGERPRYTNVRLSPDGSQVWFVRQGEGEDSDTQEVVFADLEGAQDEQELLSGGEVPSDADTIPAGEDIYWTVSWDNELQIMERDSTEGAGNELTYYTDGTETVPYQITVEDLGERSGTHEYDAIRRTGADSYVAKASAADRDSETEDQLIAFRVTDSQEVADLELLTESTESRLGDVYPDVETDELLMAEMGNSGTYEPFYAMPLDAGDEPRLRFDELEENDEQRGHYENIIGVYPADKSESAVIPQLQ